MENVHPVKKMKIISTMQVVWLISTHLVYLYKAQQLKAYHASTKLSRPVSVPSNRAMSGRWKVRRGENSDSFSNNLCH